jgi:hypothetical protein
VVTCRVVHFIPLYLMFLYTGWSAIVIWNHCYLYVLAELAVCCILPQNIPGFIFESFPYVLLQGFSSSVMRPTATDPGDPVLPSTAKVTGIDRIKAPYMPSKVEYLEQDVSWQDFQQRLDKAGL